VKSGVYDFLANIKHHPAGHTAYGDTSFSLDNVEGRPGISSLIYGWGLKTGNPAKPTTQQELLDSNPENMTLGGRTFSCK